MKNLIAVAVVGIAMGAAALSVLHIISEVVRPINNVLIVHPEVKVGHDEPGACDDYQYCP